MFSDVNAGTVGDVVCKFIEDFAAAGITGGCGGGRFCPNEPVTRHKWQFLLRQPSGDHRRHRAQADSAM